jgi:hypothetical protein
MVTNPAHGTLSLNANGSFTYTPAADYSGQDSFTYRASDGNIISNTATVTITVNGSTPPPDENNSSGGGGGGGSGATSLAEYTTGSGKFVVDATIESIDGNVKLTIPKDTIAENKNGQRLYSISIKLREPPPAPPPYCDIVGWVYDVGPLGATFDPPVDLSFKYKDADIPEGVAEKNLVLAMYDWDTRQWQELESSVDTETNYVTAKFDSLLTYAILAHIQPASFRVTDFTLTPQEIGPGESVAITARVENTGDLTGSYEVVLQVDSKVWQTHKVTLDGGDSETVSFIATSDVTGTHQVSIGDLRATFTIKTPQASATFTTGALNITPAAVNPGESLNLSILVTNTGSLPGRYKVILKIDDISVQTREVTLDGGASETVSFTITPDTIGRHRVDINGLRGIYDVKPPPPVARPAPPKLEVSNFSVTPSYDQATGKLISARVVYQMSRPYVPSPNTSLILKVLLDGNLFETIPLLTLSQLQSDGRTGILVYIPSSGWETGQYTFQAELNESKKLVQSTPLVQFAVTPEAIAKTSIWKPLGMIISAVIVVIIVAVLIVLYRRQKHD